ncbi:MAG: triose-phosphate isomerase [Conexivisphaerales archaeon]
MYQLRTPVLVINFKNYTNLQGKGSLELAKSAQHAAKLTNSNIVVAPPTPCLYFVSKSVDIPILAQHADAEKDEASTGKFPIFSLKANGAVGTILNHSERRLDMQTLSNSIQQLRELGLLSLVCTQDNLSAKEVAKFHPDAIAIEPPELIGTGRAVSKVSPAIVEEGVKSVKSVDPSIKVLCGAGITSADDVKAAVLLGAEGVLVASAVAKAESPREKIIELARSMLTY